MVGGLGEVIRGHYVTKPSNQATHCNKGNLSKLPDILLFLIPHIMGNLMAPADPNPHNIFIDIHDLSRRQIFVLKFQVHLGLFFVLIAVASATCSTNRSSR